MKTKLLILALMLGITLQAQDGYQFTLTQNTNYNYSVKAVANFTSVGGSNPDLESFAFAIMLQDGASIDQSTLILPYGTLDGGTIAVNSAAVLNGFDPGNDRSSNRIAISSGSNLGFPGHSIGDEITIATFDVLGAPTTGEISILDNGSDLAMAAGSTLDSFINTDTTGGNNAIATYYGQTGTTTYGFSTLSIDNTSVFEISLYPNPVKNIITINIQDNALYTLIDIKGRQVKNGHLVVGRNLLDLSMLSNGLYMLKLKTDNYTTIKKIIKE